MNKQDSRKRRGLKSKALINLSGRNRLVVSRSATNIYSQIVRKGSSGDEVLAACSTLDKELRSQLVGKTKVEQAHMVGKLLGERAVKQGITRVAFDRAGYKYHGRVKALSEGAREAKLDF